MRGDYVGCDNHHRLCWPEVLPRWGCDADLRQPEPEPLPERCIYMDCFLKTPQKAPRDTRQGITALWNDKSILAEELNVKYFNKSSFQKIQAFTCGFDSSVLWTCCPSTKPAWVCTGTESYYSLVLEHVFKGSPAHTCPFCQPQSCPTAILPATWPCWHYQDACVSHISSILSIENWAASLAFSFLP